MASQPVTIPDDRAGGEIGTEGTGSPRLCSVCNHADAIRINAALVSGVSCRDAARRFRVSKSALERHRRHITKAQLTDLYSKYPFLKKQHEPQKAARTLGLMIIDDIARQNGCELKVDEDGGIEVISSNSLPTNDCTQRVQDVIRVVDKFCEEIAVHQVGTPITSSKSDASTAATRTGTETSFAKPRLITGKTTIDHAYNSIELARAYKIVAEQPVRAQQLFAFLARHPRESWKPGELTKKLGVGYRVLRRSALRLKDVGVLEIGGSRLNTSYRLLVGAPHHKTIDAKPTRREVPTYLRPVFRYLARNCARKGGLYSCTQDDIAGALRMPVLTVVEHIGVLHKETFIGIIRHAYHNAYFIVGKEPDHALLKEPSTLSISGRILKEVRKDAARASDGLCRLTRTQIATKIGDSLVSVNHAMADLRHERFFPVINRSKGALWVSFSVVPAPAVPSKRQHKGVLPAAVPARSPRGRKIKPGSVTEKIISIFKKRHSQAVTPILLSSIAKKVFPGYKDADWKTRVNHHKYVREVLRRELAKGLKKRS